MKNRRFWLWLALSLLWLGVIFGHSCMPAVASDAESRGLLSILQSVFPFLTHHFLRKLAHFSAFAVLGVLTTALFRCIRGFSLLRPLSVCLLSALCDETIQLFVEGRSGQVSDVWLDFAGAVTGSLLLCLLLRLISRHKSS